MAKNLAATLRKKYSDRGVVDKFFEVLNKNSAVKRIVSGENKLGLSIDYILDETTGEIIQNKNTSNAEFLEELKAMRSETQTRGRENKHSHNKQYGNTTKQTGAKVSTEKNSVGAGAGKVHGKKWWER